MTGYLFLGYALGVLLLGGYALNLYLCGRHLARREAARADRTAGGPAR